MPNSSHISASHKIKFTEKFPKLSDTRNRLYQEAQMHSIDKVCPIKYLA